jgi:hypothetical protein
VSSLCFFVRRFNGSVVEIIEPRDPVSNFTQELIQFVQHLFIVMNDGATGLLPLTSADARKIVSGIVLSVLCLALRLVVADRSDSSVTVAIARLCLVCAPLPNFCAFPPAGLAGMLRQIPDLHLFRDDCPGIGTQCCTAPS